MRTVTRNNDTVLGCADINHGALFGSQANALAGASSRDAVLVTVIP